ncbi:MAG TPA: hypothetical protein VKE94_23405, partial [Gemmataceae bacterium]|nr:hypothetical protein [Gemmataceae bacterium]
MSRSSHAAFLTGVFFTFLPTGLLTDIPRLGADSPARLAAISALSGTLAIAYVLVAQWRRKLLPLLVAFHVALVMEFDRVVGPVGLPLAGDALHARLIFDINGATFGIIIGFSLLSYVIRAEGANYGRVRAEIDLAREIHSHLVPRVARNIGRFEFHGVSRPSGD